MRKLTPFQRCVRLVSVAVIGVCGGLMFARAGSMHLTTTSIIIPSQTIADHQPHRIS